MNSRSKSSPTSPPRKVPADAVKVLPPGGPVRTPRQPAAGAGKADEAARQARPAADTRTQDTWADGNAPRPRAKRARSSIL